ncbi:trichohyalin-like [Hemibagrus wyckioides]|uniref:trichohyalin-like n=1 Tax=Hemibagrus wyckioides TaxID=337641 RepID=UPI00266C161D|nr:trichohyalin-like [Hemibagrus wyckioides]
MLHLISLAGTGIYYLIKKRRDGEKTAEQTDTPATEDPVQTGSLLDPGLKCDDETQTDSAVPQGSVSEAEEKSQKGEVSSSLLDSERSILEERVRELEELLCEAERERERKHKVTPAECEEKHKQATESAEQMQKQDADLKSQVDTLKDTVQELGLLLTEKHTECADTTRLYETELNLRTRVQSECKQKEEMFNQETRSLRVALNEAERKYEQVMESNAQLEIKNSRLWSDVRLMQDAMLDEERSLTRIHCNDMKTECELKKRELNSLQSKQNEMEETSLKECEREKEAHSVLKCDQMTSTHHEELLQECERDEKHHSVLKCDQMTSTQDMELLQVSHAEAEGKFEYTAQLEDENSELKSQVKTLQDAVQGLSSLLAETRRKCEKEKEKHKATKNILQFVETRTRKQKRFLIQKRKSIQESLDELERKYTQAMEKIVQLKYKYFHERAEVNFLNERLNQKSDELAMTHRTLKQTTWELEQKTRQLMQLDSKWKRLNETVIKDHEVQCVAHGLLKVQYSEMKQQHDKLQEDNERLREAYSTLESQYEELKQRHGSQMECEREQEAHHVLNVQCHEMKESSSHTEESVRVNRQQSSVQQEEEKLTMKRRKCDERKRERKREREDYNLLKARCQQMEETLQECEELLKIHCTDLGSKDPTVP